MPEPFSTPLHRPYRHSRPPQTGSRSRGGDREPPRLAGEERALWRRYCGALPGSISGPGRAGISHPALALHLCTLSLAWGLKGYYSRATADELFWLLASLARLAGFLCNLDFVWVPGTGFVHHARGVCIAPACAGMNFLIVCFVALHLVFMRSFQSRKIRYTGCGGWRMVLAWASLLPLACGAALFVNTLRVAGSVLLYGADIYAGWFTAALVHELFGICLYLGALVVVCTVADTVCAGPGRRGASVAAIVCGCYFGMTVLVPLCNGAAARYGVQFFRHALLVAACLLPLLALALLSRRGKKTARTGPAP